MNGIREPSRAAASNCNNGFAHPLFSPNSFLLVSYSTYRLGNNKKKIIEFPGWSFSSHKTCQSLKRVAFQVIPIGRCKVSSHVRRERLGSESLVLSSSQDGRSPRHPSEGWRQHWNHRVSGFDKCAVGQFATSTRKWRPPEPYKGNGVEYADALVRRKERPGRSSEDNYFLTSCFLYYDLEYPAIVVVSVRQLQCHSLQIS